MSTPNQLKASFEGIFKRQKLIENDPSFQEKKNAYKDINLNSKYDLSTVSEIFQDPDLLSRISKEVYSFRAMKDRESRSRLHSEFVTKKKPQAKDVLANRVISDDELERIKRHEYQLGGKDEYISPIATRKRRYFALDHEEGEESSRQTVTDSREESSQQSVIDSREESRQQSVIYSREESTLDFREELSQLSIADFREESSQQSITNYREESSQQSVTSSREESSQLSLTDFREISREESVEKLDELEEEYEEFVQRLKREKKPAEEDMEMIVNDSIFDQPTNQMNISNQNLALPSVRINDNTNTVNKPKEEEFPLEKELQETAALYEESLLKTAGPEYLYTYIPRQWETRRFKYVKENPNPSSSEIKDELEILSDTLLTITIYDSLTTTKKFQEIEILGSQSITNFRDAIYCLSDFSNNRNRLNKSPDGEIINSLQKKLSPSMVYIDHVFYIDTRSTVDPTYYNNLIDNWLTKNNVDRENFSYTKKSMDVLFESIPLVLHEPYVFIHQEKCEHMIMIQCIRLIGNNEYESKDEFPRTTYNLRYERFKCSMCTIFPATKMTEEEINTGFSPCYYCDDCFDSFHSEDNTVVAKEYCGSQSRRRR